MTLWDLNVGQSAFIKGFSLKNQSTQTASLLLSLGFSEANEVTCLHKSFFNGPKVFKVENRVFSLCKKLSSLIEVEF